MPIVVNDIDVPFGTTNVTINSNSYYVEDITGNSPTNVVDVPDEVGTPRKQVILSGKKTGTMTLQLETTASNLIPQVGDQISIPTGSGGTGSAVTAYVTSVDTPRSNNDYAKITVGWTEKLN